MGKLRKVWVWKKTSIPKSQCQLDFSELAGGCVPSLSVCSKLSWHICTEEVGPGQRRVFLGGWLILVHVESSTLCRECAKSGGEGSELVPKGAGPRVTLPA